MYSKASAATEEDCCAINKPKVGVAVDIRSSIWLLCLYLFVLELIADVHVLRPRSMCRSRYTNRYLHAIIEGIGRVDTLVWRRRARGI